MVHALEDEVYQNIKLLLILDFLEGFTFRIQYVLSDQKRYDGKVEFNDTVEDDFAVSFFNYVFRDLFENGFISSSFFLN